MSRCDIRPVGHSGAEHRLSRRVVLSRVVATCAALSVGLGSEAASRAMEFQSTESGWLVEPSWLAARAGDPTVKVVALMPQQDFEKAHIPGSRLIDWTDLAMTDTPDATVEIWRKPVEALLTECGMTPSDSLLLYDDGSFFSARLWWILDQLGHADKRILNGGLHAWISTGGLIEIGPDANEPAATQYVGVPNEQDIVSLGTLTSWQSDPNLAIIDARTAEEYMQGHVPKAINLDHVTFDLPPDTTAGQAAEYLRSLIAGVPTASEQGWPSPEELRNKYEASGITPGRRVVIYGATAVRAALAYFNLRLIGYEDVWLYLGSWPEWSSHPELPVAIGLQP
jgi:thiosulfate/3-mercaptopyruvate sulfurtransferase